MDGSGGFRLWPDDVEPSVVDSESDSSVLEPDAVAGIDVSQLFAAVQLPYTESAQPQTTQSSRAHPVDQGERADLSHTALVRYALETTGVASNLPARKRLHGKHPFDARVLRSLLSDPDCVQRSRKLERSEHKAGYREFRRWYIAASEKSWRDGEKLAQKDWAGFTTSQKHHWLIVRYASKEVGVDALVNAPPKQISSAASRGEMKAGAVVNSAARESSSQETHLTAVGLLPTYHTKLGQDDPDVGVWIRQGLRGDALREKLITKPAYRAYFDAFVVWLKARRDEFGFKSCSASMEMGDEGRFAASVHVHAYLGFLRKDGAVHGMHHVRVPLCAMVFCGTQPFIVSTRGHKGRRLHDAVGQGMYYVAGPKSTGVYRYTDLEPIEDAASKKQDLSINAFFSIGTLATTDQ